MQIANAKVGKTGTEYNKYDWYHSVQVPALKVLLNSQYAINMINKFIILVNDENSKKEQGNSQKSN